MLTVNMTMQNGMIIDTRIQDLSNWLEKKYHANSEKSALTLKTVMV